MGGEATSVDRDERAQFAAGAFAVARATPAGTRPPASLRRPKTGLLEPVAAPLRSLTRAAGSAIAKEEAQGTGFLFLPVFLTAGALVYFTLPGEPPAYAIAFGLLALAAVAVLSRRHIWSRRAALAALVVLGGLAAGKVETWRASTPMLGSPVTTRVTGRVVSLEPRSDGRVRLTLVLLQTERPVLRYPPSRLRLTARAVPAGLQPGDRVAGLARLMPPSGPVYPGAYDFSFESYFDRIGAVGFFMRDPQPVAGSRDTPLAARLSARVEALREAFAARIRAQVPGPEGEVAAALITGLRGGIPDDVTEALRRAGLAHVLAISGLHMALVAFTVMAAMRLAFALFPGFAARHPVKKYAAATALALCFVYLFISGAAVAAERSFIMLAVMLGALLVDRAALTMRNLAIAALIVVAISPHEVVGPGFQMSFAATAALIAGYAGVNHWRQRRPPSAGTRSTGAGRFIRKALLYIGGIALTSLIAGLATALYGAWHFQRISPLGLGANLAAMPLVSILVMPSAVAAVVAMPFGLDGLPLAVMGRGIAAVIAVAQWFSERTSGDTTGLIPVEAVLVLSVALVLATLLTTRLKLVALPFFALGILLLTMRALPDVLISEDGRLTAFRTADGHLAVDRTRPNRFASENWLRALRADALAKPRNVETPLLEQFQEKWKPVLRSKLLKNDKLERSRNSMKRGNAPDGRREDDARFVCTDTLCLAHHPTGALIAIARRLPDGKAERKRFLDALCARADLLLVGDATVDPPCGREEAHAVTLRDLARRGSLAVRFSSAGEETGLVASHAIRMPWRPWHLQRQYSREARGLPPWRPRSKSKGDNRSKTNR